MKERIIIAALVAWSGAALLGLGALAYEWDWEGYQPEQPIAFSHVRHVEKNGLECAHCHRFADKGPQATAPAMSICGECHGAMTTDNPEIKKLQGYLREGKVVEWVKVHNNPWHVNFTHKRHIAKGVACETCHGEVRMMEQERRMRSLEMGWCVQCHRQNGASDDCYVCHK